MGFLELLKLQKIAKRLLHASIISITDVKEDRANFTSGHGLGTLQTLTECGNVQDHWAELKKNFRFLQN